MASGGTGTDPVADQNVQRKPSVRIELSPEQIKTPTAISVSGL